MNATSTYQKEMNDTMDLQKRMIEDLNHSLKAKIENEVFKQTVELR